MVKNKGGRPSGVKNKCDGAWTQAKFNSFIKNQLRRATVKWAPIQNCRKAAHIRRGFYKCAGCGEEVPSTIICPKKRSRTNNIFVDHIEPIISPYTGFVSWDETVDRMFCDSSNLQVLCKVCHDEKCLEEKQIAKERRQKEKEVGSNE